MRQTSEQHVFSVQLYTCMHLSRTTTCSTLRKLQQSSHLSQIPYCRRLICMRVYLICTELSSADDTSSDLHGIAIYIYIYIYMCKYVYSDTISLCIDAYMCESISIARFQSYVIQIRDIPVSFPRSATLPLSEHRLHS
jgi:hypothetical protein